MERRWQYAPPPRIIYEALVGERQRWLTLVAGELDPRVAATSPPSAVVFQPWIDPAISALLVRISSFENSGSALSISAYSDQQDLPDEVRRRVRHRLGTLFGAALREWVDQPHW